MARILIITPKQPSSNPRMRKSADALAGAGHEVHVLYAYGAPWADEADKAIFASAKWSFARIGGHPHSERLTYLLSRIMRKLYEVLGNTEQANCRSMSQFIAKGIEWNPDLVIGHNPGALAPVTKIAQRLKIPAMFDAEDFHRGESYWVRVRQEHKMIELENRYFPGMSAITAASPLIAEAYRSLYPNQCFVAVNNAFSGQIQPPPPQAGTGPLKICWFSQVVGLDRGLQEFIDGMNEVKDIPIQLNIVGLSSDEKNNLLSDLIGSPKHQISFHEPIPESELLQFLGTQEIGLALEIPHAFNREICRTNKLYTYPLAGCFMFASRTKSQEHFLDEFPSTGVLIDLTDSTSIAAAIENAAQNRNALWERRKATWELAHEQLNWEKESAVLITEVERVLNSVNHQGR